MLLFHHLLRRFLEQLTYKYPVSYTHLDQQKTRMEKEVYIGAANPNLPHTDFGWEIDPMGFRATIREMYSRYRLPMIVTENGLGAYDKLTEDGKIHDQYRIKYLQDHIEQVQLAITDGAEMMGYLSLIHI